MIFKERTSMGVHRSKPGPDQLEPIRPKDQVFEYTKTEDRAGPIRSECRPIRPETIYDTKNKLKMEDLKII